MTDGGGTERMDVRGIELEVIRRGGGKPVLLLHGFQQIDPAARFLDLLAPHARLIAPSLPGFGRSARPDGFETVYDLVHLILALMDAVGDERVSLIGFSFGGWLAAEIAACCPRRIDRLVLVDALGIKVSDRETPDILDVFNTHPDTVRAREWADPARFAPDYDAMSDEELVISARNWDSLCLYGWEPYLHNPRLAYWLARIAAPTMVLWGNADGIVSPSYGKAYAARIQGARFAAIEGAGHHPEIEQPEAFAARVLGFLDS